VLYLLQDNAVLPGFMQGSVPPPVASGVVVEDAPIGLIVTATDEDAWVGVNVDGETNTQVVIPAGSSQAFTAQKMLYVRYNKATHVTLEYNGETISNFSMGSDKWNMKFYPDYYEGYPDSARTDLSTNANGQTTTTANGTTTPSTTTTTTTTTTTPNTATTTSSTTTTKPSTTTTTPSTATTTPSTTTTKPSATTTTPSTSTTTPSTTTTTPSTTTTTPSTATTTPSTSTTTPSEGTTNPSEGTTTADNGAASGTVAQ
jgi:hypothetical protein